MRRVRSSRRVRREKWERRRVVNVIVTLLKVSVVGGVRTSVVEEEEEPWSAGRADPAVGCCSFPHPKPRRRPRV